MAPTNFPPDLPPQDIKQFFPTKRDPLNGVDFEIGLVLGGTVSAGAYTAGVIDYLMEALDAWTAAKEQGAAYAPKHDVAISTIGGTSGGGINGAILLRAAGFAFDHGPTESNIFYRTWTRGVSLQNLLSDRPEPGVEGAQAFLNCQILDQQADSVIKATGAPLGSGNSPRARSYFTDPLRLVTMVGNVTGVPYKIEFKGESDFAHELMAHEDQVRFALFVPGGAKDEVTSRPDEFALAYGSNVNWSMLKAAALATSAFPAALRARVIERQLAVYGYRVAVVPSDAGEEAEVVQLIPKWDVLTAGKKPPYNPQFLNVDGGSMNNEPLDVVRTALAGLNGRNPRDWRQANRGVVLIDPFTDPEDLGPDAPPGALKMIFPFINALISQNRFKPMDVALATRDNVYSRFLVAPVRETTGGKKVIRGNKAIASGGLGGFLGFLDPLFLEYDFRLGRVNAYKFLTEEFMLPEEHSMFSEANWPKSERARHRKSYVIKNRATGADEKLDHLPIIPLMPNLLDNPPKMDRGWPALSEMPDWLSDAIDARLDKVFADWKADMNAGWLMSGGLSIAWNLGLRKAIRNKALDTFKQALIDHELLPKDS